MFVLEMGTSSVENHGIYSACYLRGLKHVINSLHIYEIIQLLRSINAYLLR